MATDYVKNVGFYAPEQEEIARRRKMAELLMQQGQTPLGPTENIGGWAVKRSPMEGIGKIAQSVSGAYQQNQATEMQKALAEKMRTDRSQDYRRLMEATQPTPAVPQPTDEAGGGPYREAMPATGINPALIAQLRSPEVQQLAAQQMMKQAEPYTLGPDATRFGAGGNVLARGVPKQQADQDWRTEQARLQREQRMQELQMRSQDTRLLAQDRAEMQRELAKMQIDARREIAAGNQALRRDLMNQGGRPPAGYRVTPKGNLEAIPGGPGDKSNRPMNEFQGKATLYGTRAAQSDKILAGIEDEISTTGLAVKQSVSRTPIIGGMLGAAGNVMLSKNQQAVEQAQRDFVNAVLRQESGAVISDQEFENAQKQYFPAPGDNPEVVEQKRANRKLAIQGFARMAGPGSEDIDAIRNAPLIPGKGVERRIPAPKGVDPKIWAVMTPEERALWKK